uniref:BTB domain-containing protein n=1 Tax=Chromera velia CCMP2878 TaxID=1169474 RepID=A0A0G4IB70_9ALVE|eukprot:Cvel_2164.t1-p1 / transcript=Cvel_2164.t1 / gene=Cvel_2164 / organism=Chromera_velia_CCMP2878 / gene_product=BTB/POZ domain-containing protein 9, putative / transcript_product=BTB/POZ domain-containing protein 9, putative / location=Cvel_scaffold84:13126-15438(-) / protein_length=494 / sequence_SO=supercontig / SO=protein_coding / is_pseudo=false
MTSQAEHENPCTLLCSSPSPFRELCALDEDSFVFCLEGDTDVYEGSVSELKKSSQQNPGKLFCRVPYFGIPLVLKGGKTGRFVVVVPTDKNENAEKIEEWVTAVDSLSQASIPAPVRGRWNAAAVHKESIYLRMKNDPQLFIAPPAQLCVGPPNYLASLCDTIPLVGSPLNARENLKFAGGLGGAMVVWDEAGESGVATVADGEVKISRVATDGEERVTTAVVSAVEKTPGLPPGVALLVGTASGHVYIPRFIHDSVLRWDRVFESETDAKISALVLLPDKSLVFSQGTQLMLYEVNGINFCQEAAQLSPAISAMRRLVFEGGEGADVELVVKANEGGEGERGDVGNEKVFGAKFMLSANCEFFRSAFHGPFKESTNTTFPIPDTTFEALRCVVLYLHTDMVELETPFVVEVAALARFLGLSRLQSQAEWYASKRVSLTTCASLLLSAERLNFPELRTKCINFAGKNIKEAYKAPGFASLSKETMFEIFQAQHQ